jgi:hypothetical protein
MIVVVRAPFVGFGYNMPAAGTLIEVHDDIARQMLNQGMVARYETKVEPVPEIKKNELSELLPQGLQRPRKMRGSSRKSVTKP